MFLFFSFQTRFRASSRVFSPILVNFRKCLNFSFDYLLEKFGELMATFGKRFTIQTQKKSGSLLSASD